MSFFSYRSYNCFYQEHGSRGNRRIIIIPGEGQTAAKLFPMIDVFVAQSVGEQESFKVTTIDFLGQGNSDKPRDFVSDLHRDQALQLKELFYQAGYEKAILVGVASGGRTVIEFAKEDPELVEMAVISDDDLDKADIPADLEDKITLIPKSMKVESSMSLYVYAKICCQIIAGDTEKCPYCGEIMLRQYISSGGMRGDRVVCTLEKGGATYLAMEEKGGFYLGDARPGGWVEMYFSPSEDNLYQTVHTCRTCKKLIVDIKDLI